MVTYFYPLLGAMSRGGGGNDKQLDTGICSWNNVEEVESLNIVGWWVTLLSSVKVATNANDE